MKRQMRWQKQQEALAETRHQELRTDADTRHDALRQDAKRRHINTMIVAGLAALVSLGSLIVAFIALNK